MNMIHTIDNTTIDDETADKEFFSMIDRFRMIERVNRVCKRDEYLVYGYIRLMSTMLFIPPEVISICLAYFIIVDECYNKVKYLYLFVECSTESYTSILTKLKTNSRLHDWICSNLMEYEDEFKYYIREICEEYIHESKTSKWMAVAYLIDNLINLNRNMLIIIKTKFNDNQLYHKVLKQAFEEFINKEYYVSALLSRYANDILKKSSKSIHHISVDDMEDTMNQIAVLYRYIRDKGIVNILSHVSKY